MGDQRVKSKCQNFLFILSLINNEPSCNLGLFTRVLLERVRLLTGCIKLRGNIRLVFALLGVPCHNLHRSILQANEGFVLLRSLPISPHSHS
jgi:hypothetical protein